VHLSRKSDARDFIGSHILPEDGPNGFDRGSPPVARVLFGPSRLWRCEWRVFGGGGGSDAPILVDDECASTSGADIDSQEFHGSSL
jgi:hypothetical protein